MTKKRLTLAFRIAVYVFAFIGLTFTAVFFGMRLGIFNVRGSIGERNQFFGAPATATTPACSDSASVCEWDATPEWTDISGGLAKDASDIDTVSEETGVSARMIAAVVIPEQTRFFTDNREIFKSYFEPLKILGSLTQFSLGISGIKQDTADNIEKYAADPTSEFYPGGGMAALFAYAPGADHDAELYDRLTDSKDHYYQYLYTALFIKEIESQWQSAGFDAAQDPEVIATLFNIGFQGSHPNADPQVGGAPITTGGQTYAYGQLGSMFYGSDELIGIFPRP